MYEKVQKHANVECKPISIVDFFHTTKKFHNNDSTPLPTSSNALKLAEPPIPEVNPQNPQELDSSPESYFLPEPSHLQETKY